MLHDAASQGHCAEHYCKKNISLSTYITITFLSVSMNSKAMLTEIWYQTIIKGFLVYSVASSVKHKGTIHVLVTSLVRGTTQHPLSLFAILKSKCWLKHHNKSKEVSLEVYNVLTYRCMADTQEETLGDQE